MQWNSVSEQIEYIVAKLEEKFALKLSKINKNGIDYQIKGNIEREIYEIYSNCSSISSKKKKEIKPVAVKKALKLKNNTTWDKGWIFRNSTASFARHYGQYFVHKNGESRLIEPENFIVIEAKSGNEKQSIINLKIEVFQQLENWHYLNGNYYLGYHNIVRHYFSIKTDYSKELLSFIRQLRQQLNERLIPFELKFETALSERYDNLVLYTQQQHYFLVSLIINNLYHQFEEIFRPNALFFTKKILNGVCFAEDPNLNGQSFGSSRSAFLSEIYIEYYTKKNKTNKNVKDYVISKVKEDFIAAKPRNHFDIDDFFRNSKSRFPYDFTVFGKQNVYKNSANGLKPTKNQRLAYLVGLILCKHALVIRELEVTNCYWTTAEIDLDDRISINYKIIDNSFWNGKLGICYFLAKLSSLFVSDEVLKVFVRLLIKELKNTATHEEILALEQILKNPFDVKLPSAFQKYDELLNKNFSKLIYKDIKNALDSREVYSHRNDDSFVPTISSNGYASIGLFLLCHQF